MPILSRPLSRAVVLVLCTAVALMASLARAEVPEAPQVKDADVLAYLSETMNWYRQILSIRSLATEGGEAVYFNSAQEAAAQALRLSFDFAQAQAALAAQTGKSEAGESDSRGRLSRAAADAGERIGRLQAQLDDIARQSKRARGAARQALIAKREQVRRELGFFKALQDALQGLTSFMRDPNASGRSTALAERIRELELSMPEAKGVAAKPNPPPSSTSAAASGLSGLVAQSLTLAGNKRMIDDVLAQTDKLRADVDRLRAPLRTALRAIVGRGRQISDDAASASAAAAEANAQELDQLTARFRQLSGVALPLSKQDTMLQACRSNLAEWREAVRQRSLGALESLLVRLAGLGLAIMIVFGFSELWRRATFRYVQEGRRRRQLMLIRRVVVGLAVLFIVLSAFLSDIGSWATIAGFATAGIAVALQSVILSLVAYFFLIGRYGVRAGDRVTIAGVTGDVIEVGLVRLYLSELSGARGDLHPTGRIVVFPNAVVFQPTANFYKQLPGTDYSWHEIALTLAPDTDLELAERRLLAAVETVFEEYRAAIVSQHARAMQATDAKLEQPVPKGRLRFTESGLEYVVRYPVAIREAARIDDRMTRQLLDAIAQTPGLRLVAAGTPRIQTEAVVSSGEEIARVSEAKPPLPPGMKE
jgi:small-conductance mechanosensitive channel